MGKAKLAALLSAVLTWAPGSLADQAPTAAAWLPRPAPPGQLETG